MSMYGLKSDQDLGFLCDRELMQVCVGLYQVILRFDSSVSLSVTGRYLLNDSPAQPSHLLALLGRRIVTTENMGQGTIVVRFDDGSHLAVLDSNQHYESYEISAPGIYVIV